MPASWSPARINRSGLDVAPLRRIRAHDRERWTKMLSRGMGVADRLSNLASGVGFRSTSELGQLQLHQGG
ncbi:hypothetical protein [Sorangium sp. So ce233]|uniref:hypothetical protein n=1 Tax=Sorangium sp. So ce233 TaxID=3133290 RepID=UPI003F5F967D